MMTDKAIGVVSKVAEKEPEITLSAAEVLTLLLMAGFVAIGGGSLLFMIAII